MRRKEEGTREQLIALFISKLTGKKISLDIDKLIEIFQLRIEQLSVDLESVS